MRQHILLVLLAVASARTASAADAGGPQRAMYLRYCGACHGPGGKGDGIAGSFMRPKPPDLTQIAKQSGGTFPLKKVMRYVDGTDDVRAHGDPDMPVWGEVFRDQSGDATRRAEVQGKLLLITEYLQSIQEH
ncbi:MAG: c-type cytochrome [Candidatus Binatia bacterium]